MTHVPCGFPFVCVCTPTLVGTSHFRRVYVEEFSSAVEIFLSMVYYCCVFYQLVYIFFPTCVHVLPVYVHKQHVLPNSVCIVYQRCCYSPAHMCVVQVCTHTASSSNWACHVQ